MARQKKTQSQSAGDSCQPKMPTHVESADASPQRHRPAERVRARVTKVTDFGVFVELNDGDYGFIRRKELSWDPNVHPPLILRPGDYVEALVLGIDQESQRWELSHRQAIRDPWQEFLGIYREGAVLKGIVKRLQPGGVFVDIIPGLDGWLPTSQISPESTDRVNQVLWLGDEVETVVTEIDRERRRVNLSLRERLQQISGEGVQQKIREYSSHQSPGTTIGERTGISAEALKARIHGDKAEQNGWAGDTGWHVNAPLSVLVVDDESGLREPMAERLRLWGCQCVTAPNGREAYQTALNGGYDLIFMDIGLPDVDGLAAARKILRHKPGTKIVMITGIALAEDHAKELETLNITGVLMKPLDPAEIQELIERIVQGESPSHLSHISANQEHMASEVDFFRAISARQPPFSSLSAALTASLAEIRKVTHAHLAAVFRMDPATRSAVLIAQEGRVKMNYDPARHPLEISPVKDVIIDQETIYVIDVQAKAAKFKYLLPLLDFNSFIGIPVEIGGEIQHGLFLFHEKGGAFSLADLQLGLATSIALGATIERTRLDQTMLEIQTLLLQGQLSAGLAHEINNKLSGITFKAENLADHCKSLEKGLADLSLSRAIAEVRGELEQIVGLSSTLRQTARLFQSLMQVKPQDLTDVNQVIRVALEILLPVARKNKVELKSQLASNLPRVSAVGVRLEQAFLNIMINAIQQIAAYSPAGGILEVVTCYQAGDGYPVKIRFRDDGPGIHRQLFDKIFTLGFTTRQEGSGLGLYITKGLIESVGGRVIVEESVILIGTTFLVELPAAA